MNAIGCMIFTWQIGFFWYGRLFMSWKCEMRAAARRHNCTCTSKQGHEHSSNANPFFLSLSKQIFSRPHSKCWTRTHAHHQRNKSSAPNYVAFYPATLELVRQPDGIDSSNFSSSRASFIADDDEKRNCCDNCRTFSRCGGKQIIRMT